MAQKTKVVEVVPYDPEWKVEFNRIRDQLLSYVGDLILTIEHVGSTSIEGLAAKPIIDLDLVMDSYDVLPQIIERLQLHGYEHQGNLGIEGREAFKRRQADKFMKYHLYVCPKDGKGYLEHIAFRDYLRSNASARQAYAEVKQRLAVQYRYDIDAYCEGKTAFVTSILSKAMK
ncbi:GrpB family protein [Acinetobacter sp. CUI P1]|nr:GrpB family protein [Acinetobacter sp. CUI P1]